MRGASNRITIAAAISVVLVGLAGATTAAGPAHASAPSARVATADPVPVVPKVVGKSKSKAIKALKAKGYVVRTKTKKSSHGTSGTVLAQKPKARTPLAAGSVVTITVSKVSKPATSSSSKSCTPGYSPCLPPASDYDCAGGSGNGPKYVYGTVKVTGSDPYDLDRDGDGYGCD